MNRASRQIRFRQRPYPDHCFPDARRTQLGMTMRHADGASARAVLSVAADRTTSLPADRFLVVTAMSAVKRRTPSVVVREPRTAPLSAEDRQQAVTALVAMIHE
jgi:hypothetical protein